MAFLCHQCQPRGPRPMHANGTRSRNYFYALRANRSLAHQLAPLEAKAFFCVVDTQMLPRVTRRRQTSSDVIPHASSIKHQASLCPHTQHTHTHTHSTQVSSSLCESCSALCENLLRFCSGGYADVTTCHAPTSDQF